MDNDRTPDDGYGADDEGYTPGDSTSGGSPGDEGSTAPREGTPSDPPPPPPPPPAGSTPLPPGTGHTAGVPAGVPAESRNWAMGAHLSAFVGAWVALAFVGPLVIWLIRRDQGDTFAEHHAKEALNFNLSMLVYLVVGGIIGVILTVVTLGIGLIVLAPVALALVAAWVVLTILAAVKASNGEGYRYPISIRFVS